MFLRFVASLCCSLLAVTLGVSSGTAQPAPEAEASRTALLFTSAASDHRALDDRWRVLRQTAPGSPDEEQAFLSFERTALDLGYVDLPAHALALLLEAETARRAGDVGRASVLRTRAAQIAPTSPQPAFFRARLAADEGPASVVPMTRYLSRAYQRLGQTVAGHLALQTFGRELAGIAFLVFAMLFGLVAALRAIGPAALDVRLLSARTLTLGHARTLVVLLLIAPAAVLWSPWLALLGLFVLSAPYLRFGARALSVMILGGIMSLPLVMQDTVRLLASPVAATETALSAMVGPCDATCARTLASATATGDSVARLAEAWVAYRRGTPSGLEAAQVLLGDEVWSEAEASSASLLAGNIAFNQDRVDAAEHAYLRAFEMAHTSTQRAAALFNLYRLGLHVGAREAAQTSLDQAMQLDSPLVDRYLRHQARSQNLMLAIAGVPASALTDSIGAATDLELADRASAELFARAIGRLPPALTGPIALGVAGWMLLWALLSRMRWTATRCLRCGHGSSRFVSREAFSKLRCAPCMELQHGAGSLSIAERKWREERIERWERWTGTLGLLSVVLAPGTAALAAGYAFRGAGILALTAMAAGLVLVDPTPLSVPYALGSGTQFDGRLPVAAALYACAVLLAAALAAWDRRRS